MRKVLIPLFVVGLIVFSVLAAPHFIDWSAHKDKAQTQIKALTGYDVALKGAVGLRLLPFPAAYVNEISVNNAEDTVLDLKRVEVSVALFPLLSGAVEVNAVTLVEPVIALRGENWKTPEIESLMAGSKQQEQGVQEQSAAPAVLVKNARVRRGTFIMQNVDGGESVRIDDVDLAFKADDLKGPFDLNGAFKVLGRDVDVKLTAAPVAGETSAFALKSTISLDDMQAAFDGTAMVSGTPSVKGDMRLTGRSVAPLPVLPVEVNGTVGASAGGVRFDDLSLDWGEMRFDGLVDARFGPVTDLTVALNAQNTIDLDALLPAAGRAPGKGEFIHPGRFLPETLALPANVKAGVRVQMPDMQYQAHTYEDVQLDLKLTEEQTVSVNADLQNIPGQGSATVKAEMSGADAPTVSFDAGVKTSSLSRLSKAFTGQVPLPGVSEGAARVSGTLSRDALRFQNSHVTLDSTQINFSGALTQETEGARPGLRIQVSAGGQNTLDLDRWIFKAERQDQNAQSAADEGPADITAVLRALSLPVDVTFDIAVDALKAAGKTIRMLKAEGAWAGDIIDITNLSVDDLSGIRAALKGRIGDLRALSDINGSVLVESKNLAGALAGFGLKVPYKNLTDFTLNSAFAGDVNALETDTTINALGADMTVKADIAGPVLQPGFEKASVAIRHADTARFLDQLAPGMGAYKSLKRPLDLSADIMRSGQTYTVSNLTGTLGGGKITAQMRAELAGKPVITADVTLGDFVLQKDTAASGSASAAGGRSSSRAPSSSSRWSKAPIDTKWMGAADMTLDIKANTLTYETWQLDKPVIQLALQDGVLGVKTLKSGLYGGPLQGSGQIKSSAGPLSFNTKMAISGIDLAPLVKSMVGTSLVRGTGKVNLDTALTGTGRSAYDLVSSLAGKTTVDGTNIVIDGMDLTRFARALSDGGDTRDSLLHIWKGTTGGGSTAFDTMDGLITMNKGVALINKLDLDGPKAVLTTKGDINLPRWHIRTAHEITLKDHPDIPPFTLNVDGPLDNPVQGFGKGAINDYLSRKLGKELNKLIGDKIDGDLGGVLGRFLGAPAEAPAPQKQNDTRSNGEGGASAPAATPTPEQAIEGLIKGLF